MSKPDASRARGDVPEQHLGRRTVRVFQQAVMLHRPQRVIAEFVGEHGLSNALLVRAALGRRTGIGQLDFNQKREIHPVDSE